VHTRIVSLLFVFVFGLALACKGERSDAAVDKPAADKPLRIAVIPKGTTHEFWKSVHAGAVKAARELNAAIVWKGPLKEDDLKSQIDLVQSFTAQGVSGITLAPLNDKALVSAVRGAKTAGIPVVVFDSALAGEEHASFVATDNFAAGRLAGIHLGKLVNGKGNVILLRYQEGSASTREREQGFLDGLKQYPDVRVVSDNQYGGATTESAYAASENVLLAQNASKGAIAGVFAPNESTTFGMLLALRKGGLAGKIRFVGFDASEKLVQGLESGHIDGLILQNPFHMGYLGVKTMVQHLRGETIEKRLDTGSTLVTKENISLPDIVQLLRPNLAEWLGKDG
jgi:ribose transport system substrate-binding protein